MSFRDATAPAVPRVVANHLGSPASTGEELSAGFQIGVESTTLALVRHGVVVLKLKQADTDCLIQLQHILRSHLDGQQDPVTPVVRGGHALLPGCDLLTYRPGTSSSAALPAGIRAPVHQAFTLLDSVARMALHAVCRSSHVRLHQATLDTLLDECPLQAGVASSSSLQVQQPRQACQTSELDQEAVQSEEVLPHGLVSVIWARDALQAHPAATDGPPLVSASTLQVKNLEGKWLNVQLEVDEVAVLLGATAHHATAGLLRPSVYRVVGDVHAGHGHRSAVFELAPRPYAVIDFVDAMENAGYAIADRFLEPVTARDLSERITAARQAVTSGRLATTCVLRTRSGSLRQPPAAPRRGRKRPAPGPEAAPLAEGPHSPNSTQLRKSARTASRSAASSDSSSGRRASSATAKTPTPAPAPAVETLAGPSSRATWLYMDLQGATPRQTVQLLFQSASGDELWIRASKLVNCGCMFEAYCDRMGADLGAVRFLFRGQRVFGFDTPATLLMKDNDCMTVEPLPAVPL